MAFVRHHMHVQPSATSRRRSTRCLARIPLSLAIGDAEPIPAVTRDISQHGALVLSPVPAPFPPVIWIQNKQTRRVMRARVVRPSARDAMAGAYVFAVELLDRTESFWGSDYDACLGT